MCGITGIIPLNTECKVSNETRKKLMMWFNTELLYHTIDRGRDATGITVSFLKDGNPEYMILKQPEDATDFFENDGTGFKYNTQVKGHDPVNVHQKIMNNKDKFNFIIGHTRRKTQGSAYNSNNNHPILVKNIVGIQNGGVTNDDLIFKVHEAEMERIGEVDSEAVMQLLAVHSNDRALDWESINYVTQRMQGPRAVVAYNTSHPEKVIFFRNSERPIEMYYLEEIGAVLICSKVTYMTDIKKAYQRLRMSNPEFPKMTYRTVTVPVREGGVIDINKEYDAKTSLRDFLEIKGYENATLPEYQKFVPEITQPTGVYSGKKQLTAGPSTTGASTSTTSTASSSAVKEDASVEDLSEYEEVNEDMVMEDASAETYLELDDEEIMDIEDDGYDEDTDDEEGLILDRFTEEELRAASLRTISCAQYYEVEETLFDREQEIKGCFSGTINSDSNITKIVNNLYPEIHADGFVAGVKFAEEEQYSSSPDEWEGQQDEEDDFSTDTKLKAKLSSSSKIIANLKVFLLATLKSRGKVIQDISETEDNCMITFSDEMEELLQQAADECKLDINLVMGLFTTSDFYQLTEKLSQKGN